MTFNIDRYCVEGEFIHDGVKNTSRLDHSARVLDQIKEWTPIHDDVTVFITGYPKSGNQQFDSIRFDSIAVAVRYHL